MKTKLDIGKLQPQIEKHALKYGLDFFPVIFEMVDYDTMNQLAAYGGFPVRYPHWRFGMEYDQLAKGYRYGLQKIYEMVINSNPCYAYLMNVNSAVDQKLVMAHVMAHSDFFKNNYYFAHTNRKMVDEMANHATRVRRYIDRFGQETVENFIDTCLTLENLIDPQSPYIRRRTRQPETTSAGEQARPVKLRSKKYMDRYINPPEFIEEQTAGFEEKQPDVPPLPRHPERDILWFLLEHAPMTDWQRDLLSIIREEAYYFAPQAMTKIMNEGWATYWHSTIMTRKVLHPAEVVDYAEHHAGTVASHSGRLNPYRIGVLLFKDIEDRWNKGKFGQAYEACDDIREKKNWDRALGLGRRKIFEVRQLYNDVNFIETFLTEEFCREHNLFSFAYNKEKERYEIESRNFKTVKQRWLQNLTNAGQPVIRVSDANHRNRGELLLSHSFEGTELDYQYAADTLVNLNKIWKRPVQIETVLNDQPVLLGFDGQEISEEKISGN